jgi:hypothetical protein
MRETSKHPEACCQECRGPNINWSAPNEVWNIAVDNERHLILCPICFVRRAEERGFGPIGWRVTVSEAPMQSREERSPVMSTPLRRRPSPDDLCAKCGFTYAGHIGNTGCLYPCWTPHGTEDRR